MRQVPTWARRLFTAAIVALALVGFGYSIVTAWRDTDGAVPSVPRLIVAALLWAGGLFVSSFAWMWVVGDRRRPIRAGFIVSQLGKYVPGGVIQAAGQVRLAKGHGIEVRRSVVAFMVMAVIQVSVGGGCLLALAATWSNASTWLRLVCAFGGVVALTLLNRRWMVFVLRRIPKVRDGVEGHLASQRDIVRAGAALFVSLACGSGGYTILLGGLAEVDRPLLVMSAFVLAWTVGFAVAPVPSGLGIREAVIATIMHGTLSTSVWVAASVYHRLAILLAEGCMALAFLPALRPATKVDTSASNIS